MDPYSRRVWRSTGAALIVSAVVILLTRPRGLMGRKGVMEE